VDWSTPGPFRLPLNPPPTHCLFCTTFSVHGTSQPFSGTPETSYISPFSTFCPPVVVPYQPQDSPPCFPPPLPPPLATRMPQITFYVCALLKLSPRRFFFFFSQSPRLHHLGCIFPLIPCEFLPPLTIVHSRWRFFVAKLCSIFLQWSGRASVSPPSTVCPTYCLLPPPNNLPGCFLGSLPRLLIPPPPTPFPIEGPGNPWPLRIAPFHWNDPQFCSLTW